VAKSIKNGKFKRPVQLDHTHEGSLGNLCNASIKQNMNNTIEQFDFDKVKKAIEGLLNS
jgi:argininosuccinate lyase